MDSFLGSFKKNAYIRSIKTLKTKKRMNNTPTPHSTAKSLRLLLWRAIRCVLN